MDTCVSISADKHLAKTLDALKAKEDGERTLLAENRELKTELHQEKNTSKLLLDENRQLKSTNQCMCGQMDELKQTNEGLKRENLDLQGQLQQLGGGGGTASRGGRGLQCQHCADVKKELARLKTANDELRYVNDQWDKDYREHEEVFRRFREDSRRAQSENESFIAVLKEGKEKLVEQIRDLQYELDRSRKELKHLQQQMGSYQNGVNPNKLKDIEEENVFLRTQLKTYQEDFEAERRDRERLSEEKQSSALRFEAEITSLKLQLDRCRNELVHYTTESTRLAQQLRLKNQYEEDQFKKHLESQGYIPRSPNGGLPPLDPFVENDPPPAHNGHLAPPTSSSSNGLGPTRRLAPRQFLARSAEDVSKSAPTTTEHRHPSPPNVQRKSYPPSPSYVNIHDHHTQAPPPPATSTSNGGYIMQNGHIANAQPAPSQYQQPQHHHHHQQQLPRGMVNGTSVPYYANGYTNGYTANGTVDQFVDGDGPTVNGYRYPPNFQQLVVGNQPQVIPKVESKGKYACPRCARRFGNKADCNDHKARCMS